ncbi:MAG: glycoside hydrolase family 15 protein [Micromonosporaceae bacterium]
MSPNPIGTYGLIGDTRTAALVSPDGAIDWLCLPRFDGEPVFGRLVGGPNAGFFRAGPAPTSPAAASPAAGRRYLPGTTTLETTWHSGSARLTLTDGMVAELGQRLLPSTVVVRRLTADGGPVDVTIEFDPRPASAHRPPRAGRHGSALTCHWGSLALSLRCAPALPMEPGRPLTIRVEPGRPVTLALSAAHREPLVIVEPDAAWGLLAEDARRWQNWSSEIHYDAPWRAAVVRSLLTLRLLTYSPSGAPVAAPTTSLPEELGGVRNWDYRYAWPRDASIGIGAFLGVGKTDEARSFLAWLLHASRLERPRLPVLLSLHGRHSPAERELATWPGYAGSRPVRVGNGAALQHQLDGYGWVLDAAWLLTEAGHRLYSETWRAMRGFAGEVARRWHEPDAGIWEIRGDGAHHVHSKLMGWLALDRAVRIAGSQRTPRRQLQAWISQRDAIAAEVTVRGFDVSRSTYTRSYGSDDVDAALLILPLLDIEPAGSPRVRGTIDAIRRELGAGGPLVYRYPPGADGLPGREGAFLPCSFWLVQALAVTGRHVEAAEVMEQLLALAGPLGLYAEEMDPSGHTHLGNYPQALTHAALVQAALALATASGDHTAHGE